MGAYMIDCGEWAVDKQTRKALYRQAMNVFTRVQLTGFSPGNSYSWISFGSAKIDDGTGMWTNNHSTMEIELRDGDRKVVARIGYWRWPMLKDDNGLMTLDDYIFGRKFLAYWVSWDPMTKRIPEEQVEPFDTFDRRDKK